jgi:hypothetical protein
MRGIFPCTVFTPIANVIKDNSSCPRTSATALQSNAVIVTECPPLPHRHCYILYVLYRWVNYLEYHTTCDTNLRDTRCVLFPFTTAAPTSDKYLPSYAQDELRNANRSSKFTDTHRNWKGHVTFRKLLKYKTFWKKKLVFELLHVQAGILSVIPQECERNANQKKNLYIELQSKSHHRRQEPTAITNQHTK